MFSHRFGRTRSPRLAAIAAGLVVGMLTTSRVAFGHAVSGRVVSLAQPDGAVVQARAWGDEFSSTLESLDGFTLVRDPATGILCYARLSMDASKLLSTGVPVGASGVDLTLSPHLRIRPDATRTQRSLARTARASSARSLVIYGNPQSTKTGQVRGVCVLIDFPDDKGTISPIEVDQILNQVGYNSYGNNGSLRDYYYDVSHGKLTLTHYVATKYFTAPHNKAYYEAGSFDLVDELMTQALDAMNAGGLDFTQFDSNNDGFIDNIICLYAGSGDGGLWPHGGQGTNFQADGVQGWNNIVVDMGSSLRLQTLCHETGHSVCEWPDLYDSDGGGDGVGFYCVMGISLDTNETNPPQPCAVLRDMAGWTDTQLLSGPQTGLSLVAGGNVVCKYVNASFPKEYIMIENRQQTDHDANLPSAGLAIWHVDTSKDTNDQQQGTVNLHYMVSLEQADGQHHLEKGDPFASGQDLYAGASAVFGPDSTPNSNWWSGASSGVQIEAISASAPTMTFSFSGAAANDGSSGGSDNSGDPGNSGNSTTTTSRGGICGAGAAEMVPIILLQLLALKMLGRSGRGINGSTHQ